jgi:phosphatidylserine/phosphatidylglycerophosphate/cardiolipin synthase-like enzyme
VEALTTKLDEQGRESLDLLLEAAAAALPVEMIYSDYSSNPRHVEQSTLEEGEVRAKLAALRLALFGREGGDAAQFREVLKSSRLFEKHMEVAEAFLREEFADD